MKAHRLLLTAFLLTAALQGCRRASDPDTEKARARPVVPEGFNEDSLGTLKCPENGSALRLASIKELEAINERIAGGKVKTWFDQLVSEPVDALLIRADGKIAYRFEEDLPNIPKLKIDEALVLDERVGRPNPNRNRK